MRIQQRLNQHCKYEEYTIDGCSEDQKKVMSYILQDLKNWYDLIKTSNVQESFTPLRMTLCGVAGSGKSTLISTLVTAIKKITGKTNSMYMCGPTGSATTNAGGETCHWLFSIQAKLHSLELSAQALKSFISKLENTNALVVDEQSMVSALLLGTMEAYCRQAAFKEKNACLSWGGLPVVILVGNDYQLPPIDVGAFTV